jgi:hypothetical protein
MHIFTTTMLKPCVVLIGHDLASLLMLHNSLVFKTLLFFFSTEPILH